MQHAQAPEEACFRKAYPDSSPTETGIRNPAVLGRHENFRRLDRQNHGAVDYLAASGSRNSKLASARITFTKMSIPPSYERRPLRIGNSDWPSNVCKARSIRAFMNVNTY